MRRLGSVPWKTLNEPARTGHLPFPKMTSYLIGADEVGRGALAGPVAVGAVRVPVDLDPVDGAGDSKSLTARTRQKVASTLRAHPKVEVEVMFLPASEVDDRGIAGCLRLCFKSAVEKLGQGVRVEEVRVDGEPLVLGSIYDDITRFIIRGDATDWVIGAASVAAKVSRDAFMVELAQEFPQYGWGKNMGYGTAAHEAAIKEHGFTPHHRRSFCRRIQQEMEMQNVLDLLRS
mgnify:CR=1 FL=1